MPLSLYDVEVGYRMNANFSHTFLPGWGFHVLGKTI